MKKINANDNYVTVRFTYAELNTIATALRGLSISRLDTAIKAYENGDSVNGHIFENIGMAYDSMSDTIQEFTDGRFE